MLLDSRQVSGMKANRIACAVTHVPEHPAVRRLTCLDNVAPAMNRAPAPQSGVVPGAVRDARVPKDERRWRAPARCSRCSGSAATPTPWRPNLAYGQQRRLEIARARRRTEAPAARRARGRPQSAGERKAHAADHRRSAAGFAHDPAHRARHEGRHGHLRAHRRARLRREDRRGQPGGDRANPKVIEAYLGEEAAHA